MEKMIAVTASLKPSSKSRKRLTHTIVRTLWDSLEHPPRSYLGEKFQYRTPDGSYNVGFTLSCHSIFFNIGTWI